MAKKEKIPKKQQVTGLPVGFHLMAVEGKVIKFNYVTGEAWVLNKYSWIKVKEK